MRGADTGTKSRLRELIETFASMSFAVTTKLNHEHVANLLQICDVQRCLLAKPVDPDPTGFRDA